jgi:predicted nucleic acid-binding protein
MKAVVNATPLIALALTGHIELLQHLFSAVYVPQSVYDEVVTRGGDRPGSTLVKNVPWLTLQTPAQTSPIPVALMGLDLGEQDVILLGQDLNANWLIIDERLGRRIAQAMNFRVKRHPRDFPGRLPIRLTLQARSRTSFATPRSERHPAQP